MSEAATISATSPAPTAERGRDFGDWISPILVKELRQGLKTRLFVSSFIVVQAAMVLLLGMRLLAQGKDGADTAGPVIEGLLWSALGLLILLVMPMRGLTAVSEEVKANTLDLVALTKMGSFRIVLGKWLALMAQTLLLTVAVLPYAVLRYFFGQVDIIGDLQSLFFMLMTSCVSTALCVALSTAAPAFRLLVVMGLLFTSTSFMGGMVATRFMMGSMGVTAGFAGMFLIAFFIAAAYTLFLLLETAARIAPPAECHPWARRLLPLMAFPMSGVGYAISGEQGAVMLFFPFVPMMIWSVMAALTELPSLLPMVYVPWERRGFFGRALGVMLHPGWAAGAVYATVLVVGGCAVVSIFDPTEVQWIHVLLLLATVLMPVLAMHLFQRARNRLGLYVLVQLLSLLWFAVAQMGEDGFKYGMQALVPASAFIASLSVSARSPAMEVLQVLGAGVAAIIVVTVAVMAMKELNFLRRMHEHAAQLIAEDKAA